MRWQLVVCGLVGVGCAGDGPRDTADLAVALQHQLDSAFAATPAAPGLMLRVEAPEQDLVWTGAAGHADRAAGTPLRTDMIVRTASNTKTYVAAAVLRMVEQGRAGLDTAIVRYLSEGSLGVLRQGGYDPAAITVRHLLTHTAGLFDYAMAPQYGAAVFGNFPHRWTRDEQLRFAIDSGKPVGEPGARFHYSDTGYILLGEILERVSGQPMGTAVRTLLRFDSLGIRHTWFESLDAPPEDAPPRAHQYIDSVDSYTLDPSHDLYGGGGLVSTLEDMALFYRALVRGAIFDDPATLETMLAVTPQSRSERPGGYGMGIGQGEYDGIVCYGHSGFWGTMARHCPAVDVTVVAAVNQASEPTGAMGRLVGAVIGQVAAAPVPR